MYGARIANLLSVKVRRFFGLAALTLVTLGATSGSASILQVAAPGLYRSQVVHKRSKPIETGLLDQAYAKFQAGDHRSSLDLLSTAVQRHPQLPPARLMMARFFLAHKDTRAARPVLENVAIESPEHPGIFLAFGNLALQEGRITDAWLQFEKAAKLTSGWKGGERLGFMVHAHAGLAMVHQLRRDWVSGKEQLTAWLKIEPKNGKARQQLARALFELGDPAEARDQLERAVREEPSLEHPLVSLGRLYAQHGERDEALRSFNEAVDSQPQDPQIRRAVARWHLQQREIGLAKRHAEAAQKLEPDSVPTQLLHALLMRYAGEFKAAERILQKVLAESPQSLQASNLLALVLAEQTDADQRERAAQIASGNAQRYPHEMNTIATLCWTRYRLGKIREAEQALELAAGMVHKLTAEHAYLFAQVLTDAGRLEEARRLLEPTLESRVRFFFRPEAEQLLGQIARGTHINQERK